MWKLGIKRWTMVIIMGFVIGCIGILFLKEIPCPMNAHVVDWDRWHWMASFFLLLPCLVALTGIAMIADCRFQHLWRLSYPPAWYGAIVGLGIFSWFTSNEVWVWIIISSVLIMLVAIILTSVVRRKQEDESVQEEDKFGFASVAEIYTQKLREGPLLVYGHHGVGKTFFANLIVRNLENTPKAKWKKIIVQGWGLEDSASRSRMILGKICDEIVTEIDVLALRGLCRDYMNAIFSDIHWTAKTICLLRPAYDISLLIRFLDDLLKACNIEIIVILDDFERNVQGSDGTYNWASGVAELIECLRHVKRMQIITCVTQESVTKTLSLDPFRSFANVHIVPDLDNMQNNNVITEIQDLIVECKDITQKKQNEFLCIEYEIDALSGIEPQWMLSIVKFITTPRLLKRWKSQVLNEWERLDGEVNLVDLCVYNAICVASGRHRIEFQLGMEELVHYCSAKGGCQHIPKDAETMEKIKVENNALYKMIVLIQETELNKEGFADCVVAFCSGTMFLRNRAIYSKIRQTAVSHISNAQQDKDRMSTYWQRLTEIDYKWPGAKDQEILKAISQNKPAFLWALIEKGSVTGDDLLYFWHEIMKNNTYLKYLLEEALIQKQNNIGNDEQIILQGTLYVIMKGIKDWLMQGIDSRLSDELYQCMEAAILKAFDISINLGCEMAKNLENVLKERQQILSDAIIAHCKEHINTPEKLTQRIQPSAYVLGTLLSHARGTNRREKTVSIKDWMAPILMPAFQQNPQLMQQPILWVIGRNEPEQSDRVVIDQQIANDLNIDIGKLTERNFTNSNDDILKQLISDGQARTP